VPISVTERGNDRAAKPLWVKMKEASKYHNATKLNDAQWRWH
jgi:hypothetical protein